MADALTLSQELRPIEDRYLEMADDKVAFAEQMLLRWREQAANLAHMAERANYRRSPSGMLRVETPPAPRPDEQSRAKTEMHNPRKLLEQAREADFEHRDTPKPPDPRTL